MLNREHEREQNFEFSEELLNGKDYKHSRFNILFEKEEKTFLYNTLRGSFLEIRPENKDVYRWVGDEKVFLDEEKHHQEKHWLQHGKTARANLLAGGFVIPNSFDELEYLKFKNRAERCRRDYHSITVALTYGCNMACVYCYENAPNKCGSMSPEVATDLITYVEGLIKDGCKSIDVTWYGGEPMLQYDLILSLSEKIIELCKKNEVKYSASIITNGSLLTREKAIKLKEYRVHSAQITLDGPALVHDTRRPLKKSRPSFDLIISNILTVHDVLWVSLRCNVDKSNVEAITELLDLLEEKKLSKKVSIHFAPVTDMQAYQSEMKCPSIACGKLYTYKTFSDIQMQLQNYAAQKGFYTPSLPDQKFNACTADRVNGVVVEPNGNLVKCWEFLGDKAEIIGTLSEGVILNNVSLRWLNYDPFSNHLCKSCKMLPICMGWCPAKIMAMKSEDACSNVRFTLIKQLERYGEYVAKKSYVE